MNQVKKVISDIHKLMNAVQDAQSPHTPTPWELLVNISGNFIARDGKQVGRILKLEDAKQLILAVNSHEELLTALASIHAEASDRQDTTLSDILNRIKATAGKAIAKAEVRS